MTSGRCSNGNTSTVSVSDLSPAVPVISQQPGAGMTNTVAARRLAHLGHANRIPNARPDDLRLPAIPLRFFFGPPRQCVTVSDSRAFPHHAARARWLPGLYPGTARGPLAGTGSPG